jgi:hypothetical protein
VGVKRATRVEQSLRLVQGLFGVSDHALGQPRNPGGPIRQRSAKPIPGARAARPTSQISVTLHQFSVTIYGRCASTAPPHPYRLPDAGRSALDGWRRQSRRG